MHSSSPLPLAQRGRVFGLDGLRAAAISGVVLAHASVVLYSHLPAWYGLVGHGGFFGVELFFVLSGFLIGQILLRDAPQLGTGSGVAQFYVRRWFRTLPLFLLFLAVNVWLEIVIRRHHLTVAEVVEHGFFLRNFAGLHITFFLEAWSLAIEEWFYLLFPAALWLGLKMQKQFDRVFVCAALIFFLFSTIARILGATDPAAEWSSSQRMVVIYRFDALMFGIGAAWIALRFPVAWRKARTPSAWGGAILLLALYASLWRDAPHGFAFAPDDFFARTFRFTFVSLGFALLLPCCSSWQLTRETFWSTSIRRIALWSYALYLVHLPLFELAARFAAADRQPTAARALLAFSLQIASAVVLSALLYRFFEKPLTRWRERAAPALARSLGS
ncbi:MAG: acyltransferase family protein [Chthoniobacterales bacterium]